MKAWQATLESRLSRRDAPPVLSRDLLARFAASARQGATVPDSTLTYWLKGATARDKLMPVQRGLYLNGFRANPGQLADAVAHLHTDAVISLNTVLGDAGVLNNPSRVVTAVAPLDRGVPAPHLGRRDTKAGRINFFGMPRYVLQAGAPEDRLEPPERYEHPRATPEKALMDWLYLGYSPRSRRTPPPRTDIDLDLLDQTRLKRLVKSCGLSDRWVAWEEGTRISIT